MEIGARRDDLLLRLMSAASMRGEVLANNLANQSTPGFVRKTVEFEELVRNALERGDGPGGILPTVQEDTLTPARSDGNNVNPELERNALRKNQLLYDTYALILSSRFELVRASIENGR